MISWGIAANTSGASIAVFDDDVLLYVGHDSHIKNDKFLHAKLISQCYEYGEPSEIHWYETEWLKRLRQLLSGQWKIALTRPWPYKTFIKFLQDNASKISSVNIDTTNLKDIQWYNQRHHHSHASAGYYTSGFDDAVVLVIDTVEEFDTLTYWEGIDDTLTKKFSQTFPDSIGLWYSSMTQRIGLTPNKDENTLVEWASIGNPTRLKSTIYQDFFNPLKPGSLNVKLKHNLYRGCNWWRHDLNSVQDYADIASATQSIYEFILDHLLCEIKKRSTSDNLVLTGACASNSVANSIAFKYFKNVWVPTVTRNTGSAIGAVLAHKQKHIKWPGNDVVGDQL